MLLKYGLGEPDAAERIEAAVLNTLNRGFRTGDIYSSGTVCAFSLQLVSLPKAPFICLVGKLPSSIDFDGKRLDNQFLEWWRLETGIKICSN